MKGNVYFFQFTLNSAYRICLNKQLANLKRVEELQYVTINIYIQVKVKVNRNCVQCVYQLIVSDAMSNSNPFTAV